MDTSRALRNGGGGVASCCLDSQAEWIASDHIPSPSQLIHLAPVRMTATAVIEWMVVFFRRGQINKRIGTKHK